MYKSINPLFFLQKEKLKLKKKQKRFRIYKEPEHKKKLFGSKLLGYTGEDKQKEETKDNRLDFS